MRRLCNSSLYPSSIFFFGIIFQLYFPLNLKTFCNSLFFLLLFLFYSLRTLLFLRTSAERYRVVLLHHIFLIHWSTRSPTYFIEGHHENDHIIFILYFSMIAFSLVLGCGLENSQPEIYFIYMASFVLFQPFNLQTDLNMALLIKLKDNF